MKKQIGCTFLFLLLASCSNSPAPSAGGQHATVTMRDGSAVAGTVLESSAQEIKLKGDDQVTRTIPMSQVRAVDYGDAPAGAASAPPPQSAPASAPPPQSAPAAASPATAAAPPPEAPHYHAPEAAVTTKTYVAPAGSEISVRAEETIDSAKAVEGQTFAADVTRDVRDAAGDVVIPRGANARIIIRSASGGGKFKGKADLVLDLASVSVGGRQYALDTVDLERKGRDGVGVNKRTGLFTGGGAAVGAIIGVIAGGGKGAAIGAASGAGAGAAGEIVTKGGSVKIPVETVLQFKLERALRVKAAE
jgi:hypothetical protein